MMNIVYIFVNSPSVPHDWMDLESKQSKYGAVSDIFSWGAGGNKETQLFIIT